MIECVICLPLYPWDHVVQGCQFFHQHLFDLLIQVFLIDLARQVLPERNQKYKTYINNK